MAIHSDQKPIHKLMRSAANRVDRSRVRVNRLRRSETLTQISGGPQNQLMHSNKDNISNRQEELP